MGGGARTVWPARVPSDEHSGVPPRTATRPTAEHVANPTNHAEGSNRLTDAPTDTTTVSQKIAPVGCLKRVMDPAWSKIPGLMTHPTLGKGQAVGIPEPREGLPADLGVSPPARARARFGSDHRLR
jgi:hypothetical protein